MLLQTGWILFLLCLVNRFAGKQPLLTSLMHSELFLANITNIFFSSHAFCLKAKNEQDLGVLQTNFFESEYFHCRYFLLKPYYYHHIPEQNSGMICKATQDQYLKPQFFQFIYIKSQT